MLDGSPARRRGDRKVSDNEKHGEECSSHLMVSDVEALKRDPVAILAARSPSRVREIVTEWCRRRLTAARCNLCKCNTPNQETRTHATGVRQRSPSHFRSLSASVFSRRTD